MKVPVYNQTGKSVGEVVLNDQLFGVKTSLHLITESVRVQESNARGGLSHTKTRGDVSGGGKKPWKQKGTGRARAGSTRSPLWRKGGITFGPRSNRNWELKLNKKARVKALAMTLSDKAANGKLFIVDKIELSELKTKAFVSVLTEFTKNVQGLGKKHLVVLPSGRLGITRAMRNLPNVRAISAATLNLVEVLKHDDVLMLQDSLAVLDKTFVKPVRKVESL
jgi:large subunit ribosomal protein L4